MAIEEKNAEISFLCKEMTNLQSIKNEIESLRPSNHPAEIAIMIVIAVSSFIALATLLDLQSNEALIASSCLTTLVIMYATLIHTNMQTNKRIDLFIKMYELEKTKAK